MRTLSVMITLMIVLLGAPYLQAASYNQIVLGDQGGFPPLAVNAADMAPYTLCAGGASVCPPGSDMGGFPPNTVNAADLGAYTAKILNGGWTLPGDGVNDVLVSFQPDPFNPFSGSGWYSVSVTGASVSGSGWSGFENPVGELAVGAQILVDETFGSYLSSGMLDVAGMATTANAGATSTGMASVYLDCSGPYPGYVWIRYFIRAYFNDAIVEICDGGVACAGANHLDQIDVWAYCEAANTGTCVRTGCSAQLCAPTHVVDTCDWYPEYACMQLQDCVYDSGCRMVDNSASMACWASLP